jgi:hypothetical protein
MLQIRKSPQARAFFRATCTQVNIPQLELLLWIRTRWGSLFSFLDRFMKLKAVRRFLPLLNVKPHFLTGCHAVHSPCRCKRSRAKSHKAALLCRLSLDSERLGAPQVYLGRSKGKSFLIRLLRYSHYLGAFTRPANLFERACAHCLARHPHLRVPYPALGIYGRPTYLSRLVGRTQRRHQEPS